MDSIKSIPFDIHKHSNGFLLVSDMKLEPYLASVGSTNYVYILSPQNLDHQPQQCFHYLKAVLGDYLSCQVLQFTMLSNPPQPCTVYKVRRNQSGWMGGKRNNFNNLPFHQLTDSITVVQAFELGEVATSILERPLFFPEQEVRDIPRYYLDIETSNNDGKRMSDPRHDTVLSWGLQRSTPEVTSMRVGLLTPSSDLSYESYRDEKSLLSALISALETKGATFLITYNGQAFDIPFIQTRCAKHGIAGSVFDKFISLDCYEFALNHIIASEKSLKALSKSLLGLDPSVLGYEVLGATLAEKPVLFAEYQISDVHCTAQLFDKVVFPFLIQMTLLTGLPLSHIINQPASVIASTILQMEMVRKGVCVPLQFDTLQNRDKYKGGISLAFTSGLIELPDHHIYHYDVSQMYPSIIVGFRISPWQKEHCSVFIDTVEQLVLSRQQDKLKKPQDESTIARQNAKKRIINSMYGLLGERGNVFYNYEAAARVCEVGREILVKAIDFFTQGKNDVLQCDTDGLFVMLQKDSDPLTIQRQLEAHIALEFIHFEFDGPYPRMLMTAKVVKGQLVPLKKRYVLFKADHSFQVCGFESKRRGTIPLIASFQMRCFEICISATVSTYQQLLKEHYQATMDGIRSVNLRELAVQQHVVNPAYNKYCKTNKEDLTLTVVVKSSSKKPNISSQRFPLQSLLSDASCAQNLSGVGNNREFVDWKYYQAKLLTHLNRLVVSGFSKRGRE